MKSHSRLERLSFYQSPNPLTVYCFEYYLAFLIWKKALLVHTGFSTIQQDSHQDKQTGPVFFFFNSYRLQFQEYQGCCFVTHLSIKLQACDYWHYSTWILLYCGYQLRHWQINQDFQDHPAPVQCPQTMASSFLISTMLWSHVFTLH